MLNVAYRCPECDREARCEISAATRQLSCPACGRKIVCPADAIDGGNLRRCLVCPSTDLFVRKDFPQRLGVGLVVLGFIASCIAWANYQIYWAFGILFFTALVDVVLYVVVKDCLMCYRCHAQYRGMKDMEKFGAFDLETHERHRQTAARMKAI